jgi:hypothetical protein
MSVQPSADKPYAYVLAMPTSKVPMSKVFIYNRALVEIAQWSLVPRYLVLVKPQNSQIDAEKVTEEIMNFARQINLPVKVQIMSVEGNMVDDVVSVRQAILNIRQPNNAHLRVFFALFDGADSWSSLVLLTTASVIRFLVWEDVSLEDFLYLHVDGDVVAPQRLGLLLPIAPEKLSKSAYNVLKIVARGVDTAKEIHKAYIKEYEKVSRRFIIKELNKLIKARLVERSGVANNYTYSLTELGKLIVG